MAQWITSIVVMALLTGVVQTWAQSKVMTEAELDKFIDGQAKAYRVVINGTNPDHRLEYEKLFSTPEAYEGKIVLVMGEVYSAPELFVNAEHRVVFHVRGVDPKSKALQYGKYFLLLGVWERSRVVDNLYIKTFVEKAGLTAKGGLNAYLICGVLIDHQAKTTEVICDTLKNP